MTTNCNIYYNYVEYFAKTHLSFTEPLSDLYGTLRFRGILFKKCCPKQPPKSFYSHTGSGHVVWLEAACFSRLILIRALAVDQRSSKKCISIITCFQIVHDRFFSFLFDIPKLALTFISLSNSPKD